MSTHVCARARDAHAVTHTSTRVTGSGFLLRPPLLPPLSFALEIGSKTAGALIAPRLVARRGQGCHLCHLCLRCHLPPAPAGTVPARPSDPSAPPALPALGRRGGGGGSALAPGALRPQHPPRPPGSRGTRRAASAAVSRRAAPGSSFGGVGSRLPSSPALSRPPGGPLRFLPELMERLVPNQAPARIQTPLHPCSHRPRAPTREPPGCWPNAGVATSCRRRRKRVPVPFCATGAGG